MFLQSPYTYIYIFIFGPLTQGTLENQERIDVNMSDGDTLAAPQICIPVLIKPQLPLQLDRVWIEGILATSSPVPASTEETSMWSTQSTVRQRVLSLPSRQNSHLYGTGLGSQDTHLNGVIVESHALVKPKRILATKSSVPEPSAKLPFQAFRRAFRIRVHRHQCGSHG